MAEKKTFDLIRDRSISTVAKSFFASYSGFERDAKLLILANTLWSISEGFWGIVIAPYLDILGMDWTQIGFVMMVALLTSAFLSIPFGMLADRYGRKRFILLGTLLSVISYAIYFVATDFTVFCLAELVRGVGIALYWPPFYPLISEKATEEKRKYVMGLSFFGYSIGLLIGKLIGGIPEALTSLYGFEYTYAIRCVFLVAAFIFFTSVFTSLLIKESKRQHDRRKMRLMNLKSWRVTGWFSFTQVLMFLGSGFTAPWFSLYFTKKFGVALSLVGVTFAVSQIGMAISSIIAPKIAEKIGSVKTTVYTQGAAIAALILIALSPNFTVASVFFLLRLFLIVMSGPVQTSYLMGLIPEEERASVNAIVTASWQIPLAAIRPVAGYVMEHTFLDLNLFISASLYASSTAIFYAVFKHKDDKEEKAS